jgi:CheY-like chemotaxis protein
MHTDKLQSQPISICTLKLLIVEDELPSLELMSEVLRSMEIEVYAASGSQKAARMVVEQKFDCIFAD